jgi:hypothetical protein
MSEIARRPETVAKPIAMGVQGLALRTLDDAFRFAKYVVASRLAPEGDTPESVLIKLQAGAELGFPPMRALSALVVVNGRLSIMGEAALALCRASGKFKEIRVGVTGDGDARHGFASFIRMDTGETDTVTFSVADAKAAKLWMKKTPSGKDTPWVGYQDDMLIWKAVSRFAKRYASDVLMGLDAAEVVPDHRPMVATSTDTPRELPPADDTDDPIFDVEVSHGSA